MDKRYKLTRVEPRSLRAYDGSEPHPLLRCDIKPIERDYDWPDRREWGQPKEKDEVVPEGDF